MQNIFEFFKAVKLFFPLFLQGTNMDPLITPNSTFFFLNEKTNDKGK